MLRRSIQITVLKDTERLTDLREGVHREREREREQVQIFVRRYRLFFVYPLGEKGTPRGLSSPVVRYERY